MSAQPTSEGGLTYADWLGHVLPAHIETGAPFVSVRVQVVKRGVSFCGRVLEASPARAGEDTDWFKVDCQLGQSWFPDKNVRLCFGDSRCHCAASDKAPEGARACAGASGVLTVPPGNTGTTVGGVA